MSVLAAYPDVLLATLPSHEKHVLCVSKTVFKTIFSFFSPLNLLWLFIVFFVWTSLKDTVFTHKLSWISLSLHQSLRKGMDFVSFSVCSSYLALYLLDCVFFLVILFYTWYLNIGIRSLLIIMCILLILWFFTLLSIHIGTFVSHTHTLSYLRPYSHEFRA